MNDKPVTPDEYKAVVREWVKDYRKPRRTFYRVESTAEIQGKWQKFGLGKQFIGYRYGRKWHLIALNMKVRFPVAILNVPDSCLEKISQITDV